MRFFVVILFLAIAPWAVSELWTNAAGHSIEAELVSRKGDLLTMKRKDGSTFTIHIQALSEACRKKVDEKFPERQLTHEEVVKQRREQRLRLLHEKKQSDK